MQELVRKREWGDLDQKWEIYIFHYFSSLYYVIFVHVGI